MDESSTFDAGELGGGPLSKNSRYATAFVVIFVHSLWEVRLYCNVQQIKIAHNTMYI